MVFAHAAWEDPRDVFPLCVRKRHAMSQSKPCMCSELRRTESWQGRLPGLRSTQNETTLFFQFFSKWTGFHSSVRQG